MLSDFVQGCRHLVAGSHPVLLGNRSGAFSRRQHSCLVQQDQVIHTQRLIKLFYVIILLTKGFQISQAESNRFAV
jgi:hypothetical protein